MHRQLVFVIYDSALTQLVYWLCCILDIMLGLYSNSYQQDVWNVSAVSERLYGSRVIAGHLNDSRGKLAFPLGDIADKVHCNMVALIFTAVLWQGTC